MKTKIDLAILRFRHLARAAIRAYLDEQGFIELETPYLLSANTPDPFIDPIFAMSALLGDRGLQLHTSPEIWLKKGLALGLNKIYQMARVFRDDPLDRSHHREFAMLEWYRVNATLDDLVHDVEAIFRETIGIANDLNLVSSNTVPAFLQTDLQTLFLTHAQIDLSATLREIESGDVNVLQRLLALRGEHLPQNASFEDGFFHIMLKYVEPNLPPETPVVISRWPHQLAALARPCPDNPLFSDRFEIYFRGLEIANAYQESADADLLRKRFNADNEERKLLKKPVFSIDEDFLNCMKDLPITAGIALGIDRLFQAVLGKAEIADLIFGFGDH